MTSVTFVKHFRIFEYLLNILKSFFDTDLGKDTMTPFQYISMTVPNNFFKAKFYDQTANLTQRFSDGVRDPDHPKSSRLEPLCQCWNGMKVETFPYW